MCGRFTLFAPPRDVEERFEASFDYPFERRYNAAPSQLLPVITDEAPETIQALEWGLIPPWADDRSDGGIINARAETLADKPSFRDAFQGVEHSAGATTAEAAGPCLVLADGFYEWTQTDRGKRPFRVARVDGRPFAMAGLWTRWRPPETQAGLGEFASDSGPDADPDLVETFTIVTTEPNEVVAELHDRMAVILPDGSEREWLDTEADAGDLLAPFDASQIRAYQVSRAVNDPSNDRPDLVEEVQAGG
ncbi:SOS response-associated peptidase [Halobacteriales archaeon Cl-PHB]